METNYQLVQEIQRTVEIWNITTTARALQVSVHTLKKLLKTGKSPPEVIARPTEIGLVKPIPGGLVKLADIKKAAEAFRNLAHHASGSVSVTLGGWPISATLTKDGSVAKPEPSELARRAKGSP
jgi:hypothetical protein